MKKTLLLLMLVLVLIWPSASLAAKLSSPRTGLYEVNWLGIVQFYAVDKNAQYYDTATQDKVKRTKKEVEVRAGTLLLIDKILGVADPNILAWVGPNQFYGRIKKADFPTPMNQYEGQWVFVFGYDPEYAAWGYADGDVKPHEHSSTGRRTKRLTTMQPVEEKAGHCFEWVETCRCGRQFIGPNPDAGCEPHRYQNGQCTVCSRKKPGRAPIILPNP